MFEVYTKALAVLDVLEDTVRRIKYSQTIQLTSSLRRQGLLDGKSISWLIDSLNPKQAHRFYQAMATIENNFSRLKNDDKYFMETEGPIATGFYLSYLKDHDSVIERAFQIFHKGRKVTPGLNSLDDVARTLCDSPTWVAEVLIPSVDPRYAVFIRNRLKLLIRQKLKVINEKSLPVPHQVTEQLMKLERSLPHLQFCLPVSAQEKASHGRPYIRFGYRTCGA